MAHVERMGVMELGGKPAITMESKYGAYLKERGWHGPIVFVADPADKLADGVYRPTPGQEPNCDEVLAMAKGWLE